MPFIIHVGRVYRFGIHIVGRVTYYYMFVLICNCQCDHVFVLVCVCVCSQVVFMQCCIDDFACVDRELHHCQVVLFPCVFKACLVLSDLYDCVVV